MTLQMPIIVLAAGLSRRMGDADKLLEDVDGVPLIRQQALKARAATTGSVIVTLPPGPHPRYAALAELEVLCLPIPDAEEGMNASLRRAVRALPSETRIAMILLGDLPDLTKEDLIRVGMAAECYPDCLVWRGATSDGAAGHPIVFHQRLFEDIAALRGDSGGKGVVARAGDRVRLVPLEGNRARADLDTPEAWAAWRAARGEVSR
jgi:CTP:molybdopterin cytidylyltransferase MocA